MSRFTIQDLLAGDGSPYVEIGRGKLQSTVPMMDGIPIVIYRGEDGQLWAQPVSEFERGRSHQGAPYEQDASTRVGRLQESR